MSAALSRVGRHRGPGAAAGGDWRRPHALLRVVGRRLGATLVYVLPAESVTEVAFTDVLFHAPTTTISRSPVVTLAPSVAPRLVDDSPPTWPVACWTNVGVAYEPVFTVSVELVCRPRAS